MHRIGPSWIPRLVLSVHMTTRAELADTHHAADAHGDFDLRHGIRYGGYTVERLPGGCAMIGGTRNACPRSGVRVGGKPATCPVAGSGQHSNDPLNLGSSAGKSWRPVTGRVQLNRLITTKALRGTLVPDA